MSGKFLHLLQDYATAFCVAAEAIAPSPTLAAQPPLDTPVMQAVLPGHMSWSAEASKLLWEDIQEKSRTQPYVGTYQIIALTGHVPAGPH